MSDLKPTCSQRHNSVPVGQKNLIKERKKKFVLLLQVRIFELFPLLLGLHGEW